MRTLSRMLSRFCYDHPRLGIPGLMKYIAIGNVLVYLLDMVSQGTFSMIIAFYPGLILQGQVWRLITFVFVPMSEDIWFIFSVLLYYFIGNALEQQWGTVRFTVFYGLGILLNILSGFVIYFALGQPIYWMTASMGYVNMSMFFAFATLFPETQFRIYFIIPVKVKWLAWLDAAWFGYTIGYYLFARVPVMALMPIVGIFNYLIVFWDDLMALMGRGAGRVAHRANPQTINFKKAQRQVQQRRGYLHKCSVCGVTDAERPDMEFRYCSKCNGYYCYCMDHINNHIHVQ